jgi:signal-transduction protein with cAMP-binding, CBS, and nucleotidyltransferase domain
MYVDEALAEAGMQRCPGNDIPMQVKWKPLRKEDKEEYTAVMIIDSG